MIINMKTVAEGIQKASKKDKLKKEKILSKEYRPAHHLRAINWKAFIQSAIKTGLESPTPYKVIPYKNGIGIKKIEFFKSSLFKPRW